MTLPVRYVPLAVALLVVSPAARAADDKADEALKKFKGMLQGKWQMTVRVQDGEKSDADLVKKRTVTFDGDKYTLKDDDKALAEVPYTVDPSKTPARFDLTPAEGTSWRGVIKVDGDTLTFCIGSEDPRPDDFKSESGTGRILAEFKRVKK
jgi:uncharacterized protein (TIGR03067 family)